MPLLHSVRARAIMADAGVDVLIATSPGNVAYMSDYLCVSHRVMPGVQIYGILPADEATPLGLIIPSLEVDAWAEQPGTVDHISVYGVFHRNRGTTPSLAIDDQRICDATLTGTTYSDAVEALVSALADRGLKAATIGLDEGNLTVDTWTAIVEALPQARIVRGAELFRTIRMVKTETEIKRIARATEITEQGIQYVFECAEAGITERELARQFKARVSELGGDPAFWVLSAGRRTAHTHARQSTYAVKPGDLLKLDMGCTYDFYWSDVGRTKTVGEPDERVQQIYATLCAGLRAAIDHIRPGVRSSEIFDVAVNTIQASGIPDYRRHHCGHGIGINVYDDPLIRPSGHHDIYAMGIVDPPLEAGMVINLETPYYLLGEYGFIVEETMVVREDGPELLTRLDHSFTVGE